MKPYSNLAGLLALVITVLGGGAALAGVGEVITLPRKIAKYPNEAKLEIETYWANGVGYRPVKVTLINVPKGKAAGTPLGYDRDFRVSLRPRDYGYGTEVIAVEAIVEIPAGAGRGSAWVAVPQFAQWQMLEIEVREGGARLPELSEITSLNANNFGWGSGAWMENSPAVLFIDSDVPPRLKRENEVRTFGATGTPPPGTVTTRSLPDIRNWQEIVPVVNNRNRTINTTTQQSHSDAVSNTQILKFVADNDKVEMLPPDELPDKWLHYSCLDLIFVSLADAKLMATKHPERWQAVREWAAAGNTLVVVGVGTDLSGTAELEKLLGMTPSPPPTKVEVPPPSTMTAKSATQLETADIPKPPETKPTDSTEWQPANTNKFADMKTWSTMAQNQMGYGTQSVDTNQPPATNNKPNTPTANDPPPFAIRTYGLGRVVAMVAEDPLTGSPDQMSWCVNQLGSQALTSTSRHGMSFLQGNNDLYNYLIAGTQRVPVAWFLVLISVFMVAIGPVNYFWLNRSRRLYLLLVTVPAGAALVTFSLFAFAIISDGLGVRFRSRSFTTLDQRTGQMAAWSRQTYYAGLAPSGGLTFGTDTAVYPIDDFPDPNRRRELAWGEDTQQLRNGFLRSRESAQFLTIRSTTTSAKLAVTGGEKGAPPRAVNELGAEIVHLMLRDKDGTYYMASDIAVDAEAVFTPANVKDAVTPLREFASENGPKRVDFDPRDTQYGLLGYNRRRYYNNYGYYSNDGRAVANSTSSILETQLNRVTANSFAIELAPGTYLAVLATQPEMPPGHEPVQASDSVHVVEGRW